MMKRSFTLIEALIAVALFSVMFGVLMSTLIMGRNSFQTGPEQQELQNKVRQAIDIMIRELYNSNKDKVTIIGGSAITFRVPIGYDGSGNLRWGAEGTEGYDINYSVASGQLTRTVLNGGSPVGTPRILSTDVHSLSFSLTTKTLTIALSLQRSILGRVFAENLSSKITFRN